jgi:serine protease
MVPMHLASRKALLLRVALATLAALTAWGCAGPAEDGPYGEARRTPLGLANAPLIETARGPAVADELLVSLAPAATHEADSLAHAVGAEIVWRAGVADAYLFRFASAGAAEAAAAVLAGDRRVHEVAPHAIARGSGEQADAIRALQWNLPAIGLGEEGAPTAGSSVRVAILDSGVAYEDHVDEHGTYVLAPSLDGVSFVAPYDFVELDEHANDALGHGTHIASLIAAQRVLAPVAGGVEIMPVRVLDETGLGTELALAEGIVYAADHGADVINLSLSFPPAYFPSRVLLEAIDYAAERGVVMVAAAGNHGGDLVAYPAAFRDVIAAGASALAYGQPHPDVAPHLERAPYSNRGFLVDVLAPGGRIDRDVLGNGLPDGIIAEAFAGDPTAIQPMLFAGTSQAAAHVTGVVAAMLAERPQLKPHEVRALLGDTAQGARWSLAAGLDPELARGHVQALDAAAAAAGAPDAPPRYFAGVLVSIEERSLDKYAARADPVRFARAKVEVVDLDGQPVPGVIVHGSFTGSGYGSFTGRTDGDGIAEFRSRRLLGGGQVVAFQAEAVVDARRGIVERPVGLLRSDTCSIERLAEFAEEVGADGFGTSPGLTGTPLAIASPGESAREIDSLLLLNFSWSMATVPMAVAADAAWFRKHFEDADTYTLPSEGTGFGTSPLTIDQYDGDRDGCLSILLSTFSAGSDGFGTSPGGFGTSPGSVEMSPFGFGTSPGFVPLTPDPHGNCGSNCGAYRDTLVTLWLEAHEGAGFSEWSEELGVSRERYEHLKDMVRAYARFGGAVTSSPVARYMSVLGAAGIGLTPPAEYGVDGYGMTYAAE